MRKMGGLARYLPWTNPLMWIGSLSLAGIGVPFLFGGIGFAGFHSKDTILQAAWGAHSGRGEFALLLGIAAAFITAVYSWRLLFMTFYGSPRADHHVLEHAHEAPLSMMIPNVVLAAGAVLAGFLFYGSFVGGEESMAHFWAGAGQSPYAPFLQAFAESHA